MVIIDPAAPPPEAEIQAALDKIAPKSWLSSLWDSISETVADFFNWMFRAVDLDYQVGGSDAVVIILIIAAALAIAAGVTLILVRVLKKRRISFETAEENIDPMEKSISSANSGSFDEALFWLLVYALDTLEARGYIRLDDSMTNFQYASAVSASGFFGWESFAKLAGTATRARYGGLPATREEYYDLLSEISGWQFEAAV